MLDQEVKVLRLDISSQSIQIPHRSRQHFAQRYLNLVRWFTSLWNIWKLNWKSCSVLSRCYSCLPIWFNFDCIGSCLSNDRQTTDRVNNQHPCIFHSIIVATTSNEQTNKPTNNQTNNGLMTTTIMILQLCNTQSMESLGFWLYYIANYIGPKPKCQIYLFSRPVSAGYAALNYFFGFRATVNCNFFFYVNRTPFAICILVPCATVLS